MKKNVKLLTLSVALFAGLALAAIAVPNAGAVDVFNNACSGPYASTTICAGQDEQAVGIVAPIVTAMLTILGSVAVIMIVIGGIMYAVSSGDPSQAKKAKDTILYAVIGLVVALLAYAIISFVVTRF